MSSLSTQISPFGRSSKVSPCTVHIFCGRMIQFSKHNRFNTALKKARFKSTFSRIQKEGMVFYYIYVNKLTAGVARSTQLSKRCQDRRCGLFHQITNMPRTPTSSPAQLGRTPARANPLAFGLMGQNHHANNEFILLYNMLVSVATYDERVNGLCEFPFRKTYVKCTQGL